MQATYKITYRIGSKKYEVAIKANNMSDAHHIARDYCKKHFIYVAWIITPYGRVFIV